MKCLLTGATGFLGKRILNRLINDRRIEIIHVISRRKRFHPHPKVKIHTADLADPWAGYEYLNEIDSIIHTAGLYQFHQSFEKNYKQNVFPVLNMIDRIEQMKEKKKPQILLASTYAVGLGSSQAIPEKPLINLPPLSEGYAYTKAIAERALSDSNLPSRIFRLGVLTGDTKTGEIEKIDGPYYLMSFLNKLARINHFNKIIRIPIPANASGTIPLVPVDEAAAVIHKALFFEPLAPKRKEFFGVFNAQSIKIETLVYAILKNSLPNCKPVFISSYFIPKFIFNLQSLFSKIPTESFDYTLNPIPLDNPHFIDIFGDNAISHFDKYEDQFFKGFKFCTTGIPTTLKESDANP